MGKIESRDMCDSYVRLYLPYCLQPLKDGGYLPLNRNYKPPGIAGVWVDYEKAPVYARLNLTREQAAKVDHTGNTDPAGQAFLYDDTCSPWISDVAWHAYVERLALLVQLTESDQLTMAVIGPK